MTHPLIEALTGRHGWPLLGADAIDAFADGPGERVLFVTGDPARNLETADVAVILPELHRVFGGRFAPGIVAQPIERAVRERYGIWPTPSLIFLRDGEMIGAVPKVRDWDDYVASIDRILGAVPRAAE